MPSKGLLRCIFDRLHGPYTSLSRSVIVHDCDCDCLSSQDACFSNTVYTTYSFVNTYSLTSNRPRPRSSASVSPITVSSYRQLIIVINRTEVCAPGNHQNMPSRDEQTRPSFETSQLP